MSSSADRIYTIKLDINKVKTNKTMLFYMNDTKTSDFIVKVTKKGQTVDTTGFLGTITCQFLGEPSVKTTQEVTVLSGPDGLMYVDLLDSSKNHIGEWSAQIELAYNGEVTVLDPVYYEVQEDMIDSDNVVDDERFPILVALIDVCRDIEAAEEARVLVEEARVNAENIRIQNEEERNLAEADREQEEVNRVLAEEARVKAENVRKTNESNRKSAEESRVNAETARVEAEADRVVEHEQMKTDITNTISNANTTINNAVNQAKQDVSDAITNMGNIVDGYEDDIQSAIDNVNTTDNNVKQAEQLRVNVEITRVSNEQTRENQEGKRVSAENIRDNAENTRIANEQQRVNNENTRQTNETTRQQAESSRVTAEQARVSAEESRVNAETARVEAEASRVETFNTQIETLQSYDSRVGELENRADATDVHQAEQDNRMTAIEYKDKRQDVKLQALYNENGDKRVTVTETNPVEVELMESIPGSVVVDKAVGNTLVNRVVEQHPMVLNDLIDLQGTSVDVTTGIDNGEVDVMLEGHTALNLSKIKDPVPVTHKYPDTVGNKVVLEGSVANETVEVASIVGDTVINILSNIAAKTISSTSNTNGINLVYPTTPNKDYTIVFKASNVNLDGNSILPILIRGYKTDGTFVATSADSTPLVNGNGLYAVKFNNDFSLNLLLIGLSTTIINAPSFTISEIMLIEGDYTANPPTEYHTGIQSSFEDKLIVQEPDTYGSNVYIPTSNPNFHYVYSFGSTSEGRDVPGDTNNHISVNIDHSATDFSTPYLDIFAGHTFKKNTSYVIKFSTNTLLDDTINTVETGFPSTSGNTVWNLSNYQWNEDFTELRFITPDKDSWNPETDKTLRFTNPVYVVDSNEENVQGELTIEGIYEVFKAPITPNAGKYKAEVKIKGKNLLNYNGNDVTLEGSNAIITYNIAPSNIRRVFSVNIVSNSLTNSSENNAVGELVCYDSNNTQVSARGISNNYTGKTNIVINNSNIIKIGVRVYVINNGGTITINQLQLEEGAAATAYEPYFESVKTYYLDEPLRKGDELYTKSIGNQITQVNKKMKQIVLDGSDDEKWAKTSSGFMKSRPQDAKSNGILVSTLGSKLTMGSNLDCALEYDTLEEFKAYLQANPITVVYELAIPTCTKLSDEKIQLNATTNSALTVDSNIPMQNISFNYLTESLSLLKPATQYRLSFISDGISNAGTTINIGSTTLSYQSVTKGYNTFTITTQPTETFGFKGIAIIGRGFNISKVRITEGETEYPNYFEGLYSVGQEGSIDVTSINAKQGVEYTTRTTSTIYDYILSNCPQSFDIYNPFDYELMVLINDTTTNKWKRTIYNLGKGLNTITVNTDEQAVIIRGSLADGWINVPKDVFFTQICFNSSILFNTKNFLLNEPLRSVPSGVKDRYVKKDGKWKIERNVGVEKELHLKDWIGYLTSDDYPDVAGFYAPLPLLHKTTQSTTSANWICDNWKFSNTDVFPGGLTTNEEYICCSIADSPYVKISIKKNKLSALNSAAVQSVLAANPLTLYYGLEKPVYEDLEINPEFNVYTDLAHITNSSIIPCNMVVKNRGLQLVAYDSTKTYTAVPALNYTIDNDQLRFYGKGTKLNKAMLVDGTNVVTNGFFEGMMSTFEDCLVTDEADEHFGKYKYTAKVRGKNIVPPNMKMLKGTYHNETGVYTENPNGDGRVTEDYIDIQETGTYSYNYTGTVTPVWLKVVCFDSSYNFISVPLGIISTVPYNGVFIIPENTRYIKIQHLNSENIDTGDLIIIKSETIISEIIPYYERTQTVYLNSPFHKGDELVNKEDGLYHYHKMGKVVLNGSDLNPITFFKQGNYNKISSYDIDNKGFYKGLDNLPNMFCDKLKVVTRNQWSNNDFTSISLSDGGNHFTLSLEPTAYGITSTETINYFNNKPISIIYELSEPYYEKISDEQILIETTTQSYLSANTIIPLTEMIVTYTANGVSVVALNEGVNDTQIAVDYMLMNTLVAYDETASENTTVALMSNGLTAKGNISLAVYLAKRIQEGFLSYYAVIDRFPEFEVAINNILNIEEE